MPHTLLVAFGPPAVVCIVAVRVVRTTLRPASTQTCLQSQWHSAGLTPVAQAAVTLAGKQFCGANGQRGRPACTFGLESVFSAADALCKLLAQAPSAGRSCSKSIKVDKDFSLVRVRVTGSGEVSVDYYTLHVCTWCTTMCVTGPAMTMLQASPAFALRN